MVKAGQEATPAPYVSIGTYGDFETDLSYQVNVSQLKSLKCSGKCLRDQNTDFGIVIDAHFSIQLGDGNDTLFSAQLANGDRVDMGPGDDTVFVYVSSISATNLTKLDGGIGSDLLAFTESSGSDGQTLSLASAGAVNFENLLGSKYQETIEGDANANLIAGDDGADTLYGYAGDDRLAAGGWSIFNYDEDTTSTLNNVNDIDNNDNDELYGGPDNDVLYGSSGDNTLDGGTGTDTIWSGAGSDTIVIRSGDGSATLADADVLKDFSDGDDVIGMAGLNYDDLTIAQGSGDYSSHVVVKYDAEFLLIIERVSAADITRADFASL